VRQHVSLLAAVLGLGLLAGCGGGGSTPTTADPTQLIVESETLVPVGSACHVQGTVLNATMLITFNVTLQWRAFDAKNNSLGTTAVALNDLRPGERRPYDATGISANDTGLVQCAKIARFERIMTTATAA